MVPDISTGSHTRGLLAYLYGPGRRDEHTDPHIVAAWDLTGAPDPGRDPDATLTALANRLDVHVLLRTRERGGTRPPQHVWHCPVRTAPGDRHLTDNEWAEVAQRVVAATGIAPEGDDKACRWIAVRHADDHIHIVATTVRADGRRARTHQDGRRAQAACRLIEKDFGLRQLRTGDISAPPTPTSAEQAKAARQGRQTTTRQWLREKAYQVLAASHTEDEFFSTLQALGIQVRTRVGPHSGDTIGYSLAAPADTNSQGEPVFYGGSKLAPDLSIHRIRECFTTHHEPTDPPLRPLHTAERALQDTLTVLRTGNDPTAQAHLAAFGEVLHNTTLAATGPARAELATAARAFNRATSSTIRAHHHNAARLRTAAKNLLYEAGSGKDGAALAALLSTAILIALAAQTWHQTRRHQQQADAAHQSLTSLQTAYHHAARPHLTELATRAPGNTDRYTDAVRRALPDHADHILNDPAWPALTAALAQNETALTPPDQLLTHAAAQRELDTAHSPAHVLLWRITHQSDPLTEAATHTSPHHRPTPSPASAALYRTPPPQAPTRGRRR